MCRISTTKNTAYKLAQPYCNKNIILDISVDVTFHGMAYVNDAQFFVLPVAQYNAE